MRLPLTIAATQPPCVSLDVAANALAHAETVRAAAARVVVFPELSLTGYELAAPALTVTDPRLQPIVRACAETGSLALVGAPVADEAGWEFIAMLACDGTCIRVAYRKQYPGGSETRRFSPGERPAVLTVEGWRLGLAICRDTGLPQHAANTAALGIDVYVAGIVHGESEAEVHAERARRICADHHVWVVISSFAGSTGEGYAPAAGRSGIWAPDGTLVTQAGPRAGEIARATLG